MKIEIVLSLVIGALLLFGLNSTSGAETITFEPYTEEEEPYLIDGGTHSFDKMVADFGGGFTGNHFRFADMSVFWIYKFEFEAPATAIATYSLLLTQKGVVWTSFFLLTLSSKPCKIEVIIK